MFIPLSSLSTIVPELQELLVEKANYFYRGLCPLTRKELSLPRTPFLEALSRNFMKTLPTEEAKMYGLLLVQEPSGELGLLRAFSGQLNSTFHHSGWAPPVFETQVCELEIATKQRLSELKIELQKHHSDPLFGNLEKLKRYWEERNTAFSLRLQRRKQERKRQRKQGGNLQALAQESREDSRAKRLFKKEMAEALMPLTEKAQLQKAQIQSYKRERKQLSRTLQKKLHKSLNAHLWREKPWSLASFFPSGPPTGVGDCCAPKLLHYAQTQRLKPLALAEFWWGSNTPSRKSGEFYPACTEKCQPLMGALLSQARAPLRVLFEDDSLLILDKPSGLLTVPGRQVWNQDSLLNRASFEKGVLLTVHRLDLETSGVVAFAKTKFAQAKLQEYFAKRQVRKTYHALLTACPKEKSGEISLPLGPDPNRGARSMVCQHGKEAITKFKVLEPQSSRVEFYPLTGRSHQLRIHARDGLGSPIRGDKLYGSPQQDENLKLHAFRLVLPHPKTGHPIELEAPLPF